jgi:hypothetical protein
MSGSTVNAIIGNAPGLPGTTAKATVAAGATSAATQIRAAPPSNQYNEPVLVVMTAATNNGGAPTGTAQAGFHIVFGDANVGAPTDADMLLQEIDDWVVAKIPASATHYRIKSDGATGSAGSVYVYVCE